MGEVQSWGNWLIYSQIWLLSLIFWKTGQASRNSTIIFFFSTPFMSGTVLTAKHFSTCSLSFQSQSQSVSFQGSSTALFSWNWNQDLSQVSEPHIAPPGYFCSASREKGKREIRAWFCETTDCNISLAKEHKYISRQVEKQFSIQKCLLCLQFPICFSNFN